MAKKGDMLYAWTNDAEIKKKAELGGAVTALWKYALESKMVDAVLVINKGTDLYDAQPVLITDSKEPGKDCRLPPLRYPADPEAYQEVPGWRKGHEDRSHGQGLRRHGLL